MSIIVRVNVNVIIVFLFLLCGQVIIAQNLPKWKTADEITLVSGDTVFTFTVKEPAGFTPSFSRTYYWFDQGQLHQSQGGFHGRLVEGELVARSRENGLIRKGNFEHGLKQGTWLDWYANGTVKSKVFWENSQRQGRFFEYTPEGKLAVKGTYKNNQLHGLWIAYHNDKIVNKVRYKKGVLVKKDTASRAKKSFTIFRKHKTDSTKNKSDTTKTKRSRKTDKLPDNKNQEPQKEVPTFRAVPSNEAIEIKAEPAVIPDSKKRTKKKRSSNQ